MFRHRWYLCLVLWSACAGGLAARPPSREPAAAVCEHGARVLARSGRSLEWCGHKIDSPPAAVLGDCVAVLSTYCTREDLRLVMEFVACYDAAPACQGDKAFSDAVSTCTHPVVSTSGVRRECLLRLRHIAARGASMYR